MAYRAAPAPGFRHGDYALGRLYYIGYEGCCWSSSVAGAHARFPYFNHGGIDPQNDYYRAYGRPLRCLLE